MAKYDKIISVLILLIFMVFTIKCCKIADHNNHMRIKLNSLTTNSIIRRLHESSQR